MPRRIQNVLTFARISGTFTIYGAPILTATEGTAYTGFQVWCTGGISPITFSLIGSWPAGIAIDAATGEVSGTPTVNGTFAGLSIRATDSASTPATADLATFALTVAEAVSAPVNSVLPAITGTATEGQTLTASTGTWSGSPSYAYQWKRGGTSIGSATASTYLLVTADVGTVITVTVTATNAGGSALATSTGTSAVAAATAPPPLDGTSPTGAWSMSRALLTSFGAGTRYTTATGVNSLKDQTGNSRHIDQSTAGDQPAVTTAGPNSRTCADLDTTDFLMSGTQIGTFVSATDGWMVASFIADAITGTHLILTDGPTNYMGLYLNGSGQVYAYHYDTVSQKNVTATIPTLTTGTPYVIEWRHQGGNLYVRVNGGAEYSIASGNSINQVWPLTIGKGSANIKFFEAAIYSTVPSLATRDAIVADFMNYVGIPLSISGTPVTSMFVGTASSFTVTATSGTPPYVYSVASGTLPAGITLNSSSGVVSGTPTTVGTSSGIVIRVTDNVGTTADLASFSIAVAAAFTPASLTGLIGWWDASVFASLSLTGSDINSVADQSGGGNTMVNTEYGKPKYSATGFNGMPAFLFRSTGGATAEAFKATSFPMGTGNTLTLWYVGQLVSSLVHASHNQPRVLSYTGAGQTVDWNNIASWNVSTVYNDLTKMNFQRNSVGSPVVCPANVNRRIICTINSSGAMTLYVDGVANAVGTSAGNWTSPGVLEFGRNLQAAHFWAGPIAEAGVATAYHDATTIAALDLYLKTKWGL